MRALNVKLLRDLTRMKGQMLTIAVVVAVGIAVFVSLRGNFVSLNRSRATYYERYRFADVFAQLERAPESLLADLEAIDGVARAESRVVKGAMMPLETMSEPARALVISLPADGDGHLNDVQLRDGRMVEPGRADEVLVLEPFAEAHGFVPGDEVPAVINGKLRKLRIAGLAMSPEYVMAMPLGEMAPSPKRFAVLWMDRDALAAAYQMEGAFNDVSLQLQPGASQPAVLADVDRVLEPYGGVGAIGRAKQPSNFAIEGELLQLQAMSTVVPAIFLAVAALLLNIVLSRLVHLQRPEIATLKAVGYTDIEVGLHFFMLVLVIGLTGAVIGVALGGYLGNAMLGLYAQFFKFPNLAFRLDARAALTAVGISFGAAFVGAFGAVIKVVRLPPAEAMRPAAPARYRRSIIDLLGIARFVGPALHMIVRELERRPLRTLASSFAVAASVGLMVIGGWYYDGIDELMHTQFFEVMREDVAVTFIVPRPERAVRDLSHIPGVLDAEGLRMVPVRFRSGPYKRDGAITGYYDDMQMRGLRDRYGKPVPLPPDGVVLTDILAEILHVKVGDRIEVEVHDGERGTHEVTVTGLVDESFGLQGHMRIDRLRSWLGEPRVVSMGLLRIDPNESEVVNARLKEMPFVLSVTQRSEILARFEEQSGSMILTMAFIITLFAATITVGVVYNNARVALSLRARDLASLRVLGFRRSEISAILLGEQAIQVLLGLPVGLVLGKLMVYAIASTLDPETYRLPIILTMKSYAFAAVIAIAAAALSALMVRRKLDKLDLISVLKTRE